MSKSEEQFNELIAQLIVRSQKMLKDSNILSPYALLLTSNMKTELVMPLDISDDLGETLNLIQGILKEKVSEGSYVASVIAYVNYDFERVEAYLENSDNYCLKVNIPVSVTPNEIQLIPEDVVTEDGSIYVFPIVQ